MSVYVVKRANGIRGGSLVNRTADVTSLTISPDNITGTQGLTYSGTVASFTDATSGTTTNSYSASVAWGEK